MENLIVSDLHPHDFLISADNFVAHLQEHLKRQFRPLGGQDRGVELLAFT